MSKPEFVNIFQPERKTVKSLLTGHEVDTWSEAWRHECECCYVLDKMADQETRLIYMYGKKGESGSYIKRGIAQRRGIEAANKMREDCWRLFFIRRGEEPPPLPPLPPRWRP